MKIKLLFLCLTALLVTNVTFSQKKKSDKSIINANTAIKKYHTKSDLERIPKGVLLSLYKERINSLVQILPYIAFATKPGTTMSTLGIPQASENVKALDVMLDVTGKFLNITDDFQDRILPYSDTKNLISAILFYEEIMKSLHEYSQFH